MTRALIALFTLFLLESFGGLTNQLSAQSELRSAVQKHVSDHQRAIVGELVDLLAIPNVAADRQNIRRNADRLRGMLAKRGFAAEILETDGNPLVYGDLKVPGASRTLLLYSHYDGQPVDPKGWRQASPFTPVLRDGRLDAGAKELGSFEAQTHFQPDWRIYGRSASDDKSPIVALCAALDALKAVGNAPTANLRVILDGEEEAGSTSLVPAIARYRDKLAADLMVIFDGPVHSSGRPTVALGARGILTMDLTVFGPRSGVHSGNYGNWIPNPAWRLVHLLATMKDSEGRVLIDGFYDGIAPLTPEEQKIVRDVPDDSDRMLRTFGVARPETPGRTLQDAFQAPTFNIRGLVSAHVGAGARTIIPDRATAAIDVRLVKETPAAAMLEKIRAHIKRQDYVLVDDDPDAEVRAKHSKIARLTERGDGTNAFRTSPGDPQVRALVASLTRMYGEAPVQIRTLGGTVPIAPFIDALDFPAVLVPIVNFDNNQHEENENLRLGTFFEGIVTIAAVLTM
ncbi:MAG TPA: M20/M25/M40 family metallo-hydrolase [Vicinamibacterales bacterium]|jgi:acetylornithine deacetylase/succinyl-diaminopimelate desuccinylase-like protein|nr:M20/M25/M40 family metallo-hydrolase [Vicinamibacterales bacterium]